MPGRRRCIFAILILTLLGFLTANFVGRPIVSYGEGLLDRVPLVRNVYRGLRQLFQTVLSQRTRTFQKVVLVEYPSQGRLARRLSGDAREGRGRRPARRTTTPLAVFIPNTPNVTAGFLVFVPRRDVMVLDMTLEEAAKMIISAGLVTPAFPRRDRIGPAEGSSRSGGVISRPA